MMRRVSRELVPFVRWALDRDGIPCKYAEIGEEKENRYVVFRVDVPSNRFSRIVEDAKSEKERRESVDPSIPVLSYRASMNDERMKEMLAYYNSDCFIVQTAESRKYCEAVMAR